MFGIHDRMDMSESMRERVCSHAGIKLDACNSTVIAALLRNNGNSSTRAFRVFVPDQTEDAVIYVAVVVVFYAAIIIILVGTNVRRQHKPTPNPKRVREFFRKQTVLVYDNEKTKTIKTSHKSLHALPAEGDETVAPL